MEIYDFDELFSIESELISNTNQLLTNFRQLIFVGNYYYCIFNMEIKEIEFMHPNFEKILGYNPEILKKNLLTHKIHPQDTAYFFNFAIETVEFFSNLQVDKVLKYKSSFDFRFQISNGDYIRILQQGCAIQIDKKGKIVKSLILHTDITHIKKDGIPSLSFIGLDGEPSFYNVKVDEKFPIPSCKLSKREKEILSLFAKGKTRSDIAEILFLSKFTIDNHRKNMLEKSNTNSISELISKAINMNLI